MAKMTAGMHRMAVKIGKLGGRPKKLSVCELCGDTITARQKRLKCPHKIIPK